TAAATPAAGAVGLRADEERNGSMRDRARLRVIHLAIRAGLAAYLRTIRLARLLVRTRPLPAGGVDLLVTGTFYSDNWVRAHILPLSRSPRCRRIRVVSAYPIGPMEKVQIVRPPAWLERIAGGVGARLATFAVVGLFTRPDAVAGFPLLLNELAAGLPAGGTGAEALDVCDGGPPETINDGIH